VWHLLLAAGFNSQRLSLLMNIGYDKGHFVRYCEGCLDLALTRRCHVGISHRLHVYRLHAPLSVTSEHTSHSITSLDLHVFLRTPIFFLYIPFRHSSSMSKDTSFRFCIAALLIVQIACWALALVDLFVPGKPRVIIRTTMDVISQMFARRSQAMLLYKDFRATF